MSSLLESPMPVVEGTRNELSPRLLELSSEAKLLWIEFYRFVEKELCEGKKFFLIIGFASKPAEQLLRVAGVLTLIDRTDAPSIPSSTVAEAATLMQYYLSESLRLFNTAMLNPTFT